VLVTERVCVQLSSLCYRAAQWLDVQRKEIDTSTLNLTSTWISGNFLTTVELKSRGLSNTDEWKDYENILVGPGSSCEDNIKMHRKINRLGGKGKGKFHPSPRGGIEV